MTQPDTNTNVVLTADVSGYQQGMGQAQQSTDGLIDKLTRLNQATDNLFKKAGHKLEIISAASVASIGAATASLASFDAQLRQVRATASLTGGTDVPKLARNIRAMGADIPVTTAELTTLATTIQGLGVKGTAQITALTKTFAELGAVTGESSSGLANSLIQLTRSMGNTLDPNQMKAYASATANVAANLGTSATAVTQFAQAIQPLGKLLGLTETQLLGISGAFAKAGADGGPAFNAFNQMATLLINDLQTGNPQIKQFADLMGMTTASFEKMAKSNPADMISSIFNSLSSQGPKAIQFLQSIGIEGPRSVNAIQRVVQGGGIGQALGVAQAGAADPGKLSKAAGSAFNDLQAQVARLGHAINDLVTGPFEALQSVLTHIVRYVADVVGAFVKLGNLPGIHQFLQVMGGIASVMSPLLGIAGALVTIIPMLAHFGLLWGAIFSRTGVSLLSGTKDALSGISRQVALAGGAAAMPASAAARAMAASNAGTGPRVGMFQRGMYTVGSVAGGGLYRVLPKEQGATEGGFRPVDVGGLRRFGLNVVGGGVRGAGWLAREAYLTPLQRGTTGVQTFLRGPLDGPRQPWNMTWAAQQSYAGGRYAMGSPEFWDRQRASGANLLSRIPGLGGMWRGMPGGAPGAPTVGAPTTATVTGFHTGPGALNIGPAFARTTQSAEAMTKAFHETNRHIIAAGAATAAGTKTTAAQVRAAEKAAVQDTEQAGASEKAAVSLGMLAREATAATVGLAARGAASAVGAAGTVAGSAARGLGGAASGLMGALGGPWGLAITGAMVGIPLLINELHSQNKIKNLSQTELDKSPGTFTGNMNSMNRALGESTVGLNSLTKAALDAARAQGRMPSGPPEGAFTQGEVEQARDAAFKAVGYDAKASSTKAEKIAQLQLTEIGKISTGGPLNQSDARQFRMQLEHLVPVDQARKIYDNLETATKGFTQAPKDLKTVQQIYTQLGNNYNDTINRASGGGPGKPPPDAFDKILGSFKPDSQRARALLANSLALPGTATAVGVPAQRAQSQAQFITGLVGEQQASGGNKVGQLNFFQNLAKNLGLPSSYGNATNLQDFVANMFKTDRTTATRLFGAEGSIDFTKSPQKIITQAQTVYNQAQQQLAAQLKAQQTQSYSTYRLGDLGLRRGTQAAGAVANVLGGSQKPEDMARAVYGTAQALTKQGQSAAQAQEAISKWIKTVGDANGVAAPFIAQVQQMADVMLDLNRSTLSIPDQIKDIRAQMAKTDVSAPGGSEEYNKLYNQQIGLVQQGVQMAQQYVQQRDDMNIQLQQGQEDYQRQVQRSTDAFHLQQERSEQAYQRQTLRSAKAFNLQMARSQADFRLQESQATEDYNTQRSRANRDFLHQEALYVKGMSDSLDPWSQVQSQSTTDAGQLLANLQTQSGMFKTAGEQLDKLKKMGLSQDTIDELHLSDPKNMQQLDRTYREIAENPKLIKTFNDTIKGRLKWTKGLATDESSTEWREMHYQFDKAAGDAETDFDKAMKRSEKAFKTTMDRSHTDYKTATEQNAADFKTATDQSQEDFNTQMTNMATDYHTSVTRALQAIDRLGKNAFRSAQSVLNEAYRTSHGDMKQFFKDVTDAYNTLAQGVASSTTTALGGMPGGGGSTSFGATAAGPYHGNAATIANALKAQGYSDVAIAGVMGNLKQESGFNPLAGKGTAHQGIAQWGGARWARLQDYASQHHSSAYDLNTQIGFMIQEAKERGEKPQLNTVGSAATAASIWNDTFEQSGDHRGVRESNATAYYRAVQKANLTPAGGGKLHSPVAGSLHRGRTDQGVDWTGAGAIYAVGAGKMTKVNPNDPGWLGSFMILQLSHPPSSDRRYVYYAEGIRPSVHAGQTVRAGQVIGRATGSSTGIEIGWAASATGWETLARERGHQAPGSDPGARPSPEGKDFLRYVGHASGGVVLNHEIAHLGEKGPEAVIPLNQSGMHFLIDMLSKLNQSAMNSRIGNQYATPVRQTVSNTHVDSSTNFNGEITVQAQDPNAMANALKNKARMTALTNPDLTTGAVA